METAGPCDIRVMPLGAGQDVGGSCIVVTFGGCTVMFDCGMHMTRSAADGGHFPDFRKIAPSGPYTRHIDCVIISHLFVLVTVVVVSSLSFSSQQNTFCLFQSAIWTTLEPFRTLLNVLDMMVQFT